MIGFGLDSMDEMIYWCKIMYYRYEHPRRITIESVYINGFEVERTTTTDYQGVSLFECRV